MTEKKEGLFMKLPSSHTMKSASLPILLASLMVFSSLAGCVFDDSENGGDGEVLSVFKYSPSSNIRTGDVITFDGSSSTPSNGLTYRWDFDQDGSIDDTGRTAE